MIQGLLTTCSGDSVTLKSSSTVGNQWYRDGLILASFRDTIYKARTTGNYTVVASQNGCSSPASSPMTVKVNTRPVKPAIRVIQGLLTTCSGDSVTLKSSSPLGNQWYRDGLILAGFRDTIYKVRTTGNYTVVVSQNGCSSPASSPMTVKVNTRPVKPSIRVIQGLLTTCSGDSVTLKSSSLVGNQWYRDGIILAGFRDTIYKARTTGNYTVVVSQNGCSSTASSAVVVKVNTRPVKPSIRAIQGSLTTCSGDSVTLKSSSAVGNQWYRDGIILAGFRDTIYKARTTGNYTLVVSQNGCSSPSSSAAVVKVNARPVKPSIRIVQGTTVLKTGDSVTFKSSNPVGNQWYRNGLLIIGAKDSMYKAKQAGTYSVIVTQLNCSSPESSSILVTQSATSHTSILSPYETYGLKSMNRLSGIEFISIYPNPADTYLVINYELVNTRSLVIQIIDKYGRVVALQKSYTKKEKVDIGRLPAGQYQIMISAREGRKFTYSFIKI
jgi:hypothetical protein